MHRKKLGFSQNTFAEKIGIGQQSLSAMERGEIAPKFERLPQIAEALNCPTAELFRPHSERACNHTAIFLDVMAELEADEQELILHMILHMAKIFKKHRLGCNKEQ